MLVSSLIVGLVLVGGPQVTQAGSCSEADLGVRLEQLLGSSEVTGEGWVVHATLEEQGRESIAEVRIEDPSGGTTTRTLRSPDCAVSVDAAAFIVATAIDPTLDLLGPSGVDEEAAVEELPAEEVPVDEPSVTDSVLPEPDEVAEPPLDSEPANGPKPAERPADKKRPRPARQRPEVWVGLGPSLMGGAMPGPRGRLVLFAALEGVVWRVRVDAAATLRGEARAVTVPDVGARVGQWSVGARGCGVLRSGRFSVSGCGGAEAGELYASGFGFEDARSTRLPWGAVIGAVGLDVSVGRRVKLWVEGDVGVVLNRAEIVVDNLEQLDRLGPVFGRGSVGIALRI